MGEGISERREEERRRERREGEEGGKRRQIWGQECEEGHSSFWELTRQLRLGIFWKKSLQGDRVMKWSSELMLQVPQKENLWCCSATEHHPPLPRTLATHIRVPDAQEMKLNDCSLDLHWDLYSNGTERSIHSKEEETFRKEGGGWQKGRALLSPGDR